MGYLARQVTDSLRPSKANDTRNAWPLHFKRGFAFVQGVNRIECTMLTEKSVNIDKTEYVTLKEKSY